MRRVIALWLLTVLAIAFLYVGVSTLWFDVPGPLILGMPPLIFWFLLVPLATPLILGALYLWDKRSNPQQAYFTDPPSSGGIL